MSSFSPVIHRYTTSGMRMIVNAFIVETENCVVLIDAATALSSSREIRDIIEKKIKKPLAAVLLTHGHPDHYIGAGEIVKGHDIPIVSTRGTLEFARYQDKYKIHTLEKGYGDNFPKERMFPGKIVEDGDVLDFDGVSFTISDLGPCESESDSLWTIVINGVKHVFAGDLVYNHRHCYLRDGYALNWLKAIDNLLAGCSHETIFYPGHGEICGPEILYWQKAYIQAFLYTLKSLLGTGETLDKEEQDILFGRMTSFLPDETIIFLLKYEPEEMIKALRKNNALNESQEY